MKPINIIAIILSGLILMSLATTSYSGFAQIFSDNITFLKPYCKKQSTPKFDGDSKVIAYENVQNAEITLICTTFIDFKNPTFSLVYNENNYKQFGFTDLLKLSLLDKRNYLPPRLA